MYYLVVVFSFSVLSFASFRFNLFIYLVFIEIDLHVFLNFQSGTIISAEDRYLSICFETIGVPCTSTADAKGQQRFLGMDPNFIATYRGDRGYFKQVWEFWGQNTGGFKWGKDLVSEQMNGWHNLRYPAFMYRIHTIHHPESCPADSNVATTMAELMGKLEEDEEQ